MAVKISFEQTLDKITDVLRREKSQSPVFYFGAGASAAAGLPLGTEFLRLLKLHVNDHTLVPPAIDSLTRLGDWVIANGRRDNLDAEAARILSHEESWVLERPTPSLIHYYLARLAGNFDVVTTNYDNLIEWHLQQAGRSFERVNSDEACRSLGVKGITVLKIHGSIGQDSRPETHLLLGRQELIRFDTDYPSFWHLLKEWIHLRPFIFVGHGLEDDNLFRLLVQSPERRRASFAVDPFPDEIKTSIWQKLGVHYIQDNEGSNIDAETFFLALFKHAAQVNPEDLRGPTALEQSASFRNYSTGARAAQSGVGRVFYELQQGLLYEHPEVANLVGNFQWGNRAALLGEGGTGKTALAATLAHHLQRSRRVYYLTAKETDLAGKDVLAFLKTIIPRDLVILDDLHRLGTNLGGLLDRLQDQESFRSNLLLIARESLLASDLEAIRKVLAQRVPGRLIKLKGQDIGTHIISHRFTRREAGKLNKAAFTEKRKEFAAQYREEIEQMLEAFGGSLIALASAVDQWRPGMSISHELYHHSMLAYLKEIRDELGEEAVWCFLSACAFWQYERSIPSQFFKRLGVYASVESLCRRGDLREQQGQGGPEYIVNFHAEACRMYLKAAGKALNELVAEERVRALDERGEVGLRRLRFDDLLLVKSLEWGVEKPDQFDTHFVYQGYKGDYMNILEQSLAGMEEKTHEAAERNSSMWLTLGSIYRRDCSRNFKDSTRCYKRAQKIIRRQRGRGDAHILLGRLFYERAYIHFLERRYLRSARLFRKSYQRDFRPEVKEKRERHGWMSRLQMVVALWYMVWEWQLRFPWLFSKLPRIKKSFDEKLSEMFDGCLKKFDEPKEDYEHRFLYNVAVFISRFNLYRIQTLMSDDNRKPSQASDEQIKDMLAKATEFSKKAAQAAQSANILGNEIFLLECEALCCFIRGDYEQAHHFIKKSIRHAENLSRSECLARSYYLLGQVTEKLEEYGEAKASYRRALDLDKQLNNGFWQSLSGKRLQQLLKSLE